MNESADMFAVYERLGWAHRLENVVLPEMRAAIEQADLAEALERYGPLMGGCA